MDAEESKKFGRERLAVNSPLATTDESHSSVYSVARMPLKTSSISVAHHPSQSAPVEAMNHTVQEEGNSNENDDDSCSFISGSTLVGQRKTSGGAFPVSSQQIPVHSSRNSEPVSVSSLNHGFERTNRIGQTVETSSHSLLSELPVVTATSNKGGREHASSEAALPHSTPKAATAVVNEHWSDVAVAKLPSPQSDWLCPAATLEYQGSSPNPDAVVDPLDSSSRGLIEMVCATVNSKWPILARYFCLSEDCVAGIKEQDAEAKGRCWVLVDRLSNKRITWKTFYEVLLNKLHLNILACKLAQIIGLPTPDREAVISRLNQIVIDIHNSTHKVVLLQLSQTAAEHWKKLYKILNFDQCNDADIVHITHTSMDADECCCEMLLQWIAWRQTKAQSASPGALPVTFGELFTRTEAAISGTEVEKVVQAAMCVL